MSTNDNPPGSAEGARAIHILPAASTLVGVCMTIISVVRIFHGRAPLVAHVVTIANLAFLISAFCAYGAIRAKRPTRLEALAELTFLLGLLLLTAAGLVMTLQVGA